MSLVALIAMATIAGIATLTAVILLIVGQNGSLARLARSVGLQAPGGELDAVLEARLRRKSRWALVGVFAGMLVTDGIVVLAVSLGSIADPGMGAGWLAVAGLLLGGSVGNLAAVLATPGSADPTQPRVAHARATRLSDYLDPLELIGARIVAGLGLVSAIVFAVLPTQPSTFPAAQSVAVPLLAAVGVISLVLLEVGGRRVVLGRPPFATSPTALAWDDALRASDLRSLASAPLMSGMYAFIFALGSLGEMLPFNAINRDIVLVAANVGWFLFLGAMIFILVLSIVRTPAQYYLRRLWPELVPATGRAAADARVAAAQAAASASAAEPMESPR